VGVALRRLSLNHKDYIDIDISELNLKSYVENVVPVVIQYHLTNDLTDPISTAAHAELEEVGTSDGPCPFVVHGVIGDELPIHNSDKLIAIAIAHLRDKSAVLIIGRGEPTSIFHNPQLYPQAFPWLFLFGLVGIGNCQNIAPIGEKLRLKHLLLYHDKWFQTDLDFPLMAFNHRQIKSSSRGGFLLAEQARFHHITN